MTRSRGVLSAALVLAGCLALLDPSDTEAQAGSPAGPVPVARLEARRAALLARLRNGIAVIPSASVKSIEGDYPQDSDYRENNDFFYLTGLEAPGAALVLAAREQGKDEAILYLPDRDTVTEKWTGSRLGRSEAARLSGITDIRAASRTRDQLRDFILTRDSPARSGALYISETLRSRSPLLEDLTMREERSRPRIRDLDPELARLRLVKDPDEIERLRRAIAITSEALKESMRAAKPGAWEYELEAVIEYTFRRQGAERVGFPSIVASGPNAVTLHYDKNRRQTRAGDLVVEDVGAEFGYYTADITRTIPVSGSFTPRQLALYQLVLGAQNAAIQAIRPGTNLMALNRIAREYLAERSGDLCGPASCVPYFIHGLSHWLGMDVHDVGSINARLEPGMVLTVEPGIYLPEEGLGIRIEDDVLVTASGFEVLSRGAPRTAEEIGQLMGRRVP